MSGLNIEKIKSLANGLQGAHVAHKEGIGKGYEGLGKVIETVEKYTGQYFIDLLDTDSTSKVTLHDYIMLSIVANVLRYQREAIHISENVSLRYGNEEYTVEGVDFKGAIIVDSPEYSISILLSIVEVNGEVAIATSQVVNGDYDNSYVVVSNEEGLNFSNVSMLTNTTSKEEFGMGVFELCVSIKKMSRLSKTCIKYISIDDID